MSISTNDTNYSGSNNVSISEDSSIPTIQLSIPSDTMYRCAHCSFVDSDQSNVVAHAKSCQNVSIRKTPETRDTLYYNDSIMDGTTIEMLHSDNEDSAILEDIISEENIIDVSELGEVRRGRGLPLWSDAKIKVLLAGVLQNVHVFSEDICVIRRAWKLISRYTREHAQFKVSTKQCEYKWTKLLSNYQEYMADPNGQETQPPYTQLVHNIVQHNENLLKKPDVYTKVKTISKMPNEEIEKISIKRPASEKTTKKKIVETNWDYMGTEEDAGNDVVDESESEVSVDDAEVDYLSESADIDTQIITEIDVQEESIDTSETELIEVALAKVKVERCNSRSPPVPADWGSRSRGGRGLWTHDRVQRLLKAMLKNKHLICSDSRVQIQQAWGVVAADASKNAGFVATGSHCYQKWLALVRRWVRRNPVDHHGEQPSYAQFVRAVYARIFANDFVKINPAEINGETEASAAGEAILSPVGMSDSTCGLRNLFWTTGRLSQLVRTVQQHCFLLQLDDNLKKAWRTIADVLSKTIKLPVSQVECIRRFRYLITRFILWGKKPRPPFFKELLDIVQKLPTTSKCFPTQMREAPESVPNLIRLASEGDDSVPRHDISTPDESKCKSKRKRKVVFSLQDLDIKADSNSDPEYINDEGTNTVDDYHRPSSFNKRMKKDTSNCNDLQQDCYNTLLRIERNNKAHQERMEQSLNTLTTTLSSIDSTLHSSSINMQSFLNGFCQAFSKHSNNKTNCSSHS